MSGTVVDLDTYRARVGISCMGFLDPADEGSFIGTLKGKSVAFRGVPDLKGPNERRERMAFFRMTQAVNAAARVPVPLSCRASGAGGGAIQFDAGRIPAEYELAAIGLASKGERNIEPGTWEDAMHICREKILGLVQERGLLSDLGRYLVPCEPDGFWASLRAYTSELQADGHDRGRMIKAYSAGRYDKEVVDGRFYRVEREGMEVFLARAEFGPVMEMLMF